MAVWDDLVGQEKVSEQLAAAARDADALVTAAASDAPPPEASKMTHAWLFTGPPGAGRTQVARAFAAALQCVSPDRALGGAPGCGFCDGCHTALIGTHADVTTVAAVGLQILADDMRDTVRKSFTSPANGRWQVILVEDAERLNEKSANAVLKAVEEPAPRTVWLLCAPSLEDVLPTIRSRCRHRTCGRPPSTPSSTCSYDARASSPPWPRPPPATQGHVDRARRLAMDPAARERRAAVLKLPLRVEDVGGCLKAAQELVDAAAEDAKQLAEERDAKETEELKAALGAAQGGRLPRGTAGVMKDLEDKQKRRRTRTRAVTDAVGLGFESRRRLLEAQPDSV
ncbi:DNA polymerase III subunit delta' [Streptomyces tanashiensis]